VIGAAAAMYLCNTLAVAAMVGFQQGTNPLRVWSGGRRDTLMEFAGLFLVGAIMARAGARDPVLVVAMTVPAAIIYWSMNRMVRLEELARRDAQFAAWRDLEHLKTEFMRSVSHELRTPLSLITGFSELLQGHAVSGKADPEIVELATQIRANSQLLSRLVNDLLDFSRAERGEIAIQPQDFDAVPVLQELLSGLRLQADGVRLSAVLPAHLPVHADPDRVAQAVYNLITNAQKYAPYGPIVVRAAMRQIRDGGQPEVGRIEVEDRGPGVPTHEQARVWERFYRGESVSGLNEVRGAGVGLALVKALVEAQGGQVGLESAPGQGARFWIELPAAQRPAAESIRRTRTTGPPFLPQAKTESGPAPT
jgi:signal transduction histidine kinase